MLRTKRAAMLSSVLISVSSVVTAGSASGYIFLGSDTDTSICANIGSQQHGTGMTGWPTMPFYIVATTYWYCRTDYWKPSDGPWSSYTNPVGTPIKIGKQDIEHYSGAGSFSKDLSKVEWDFDGNGSFEVVDTGPWLTVQGTANEQVDSVVTAWTTRARYFEGVFTPRTVGSTTIQMRVTWTDSSTLTSSGTFVAVADTVTAAITRTLTLGGAAAAGPVLTGSQVYLSASGSTSLSGHFSKYEWDLDGNGSFETDGGATSTRTTTFSDPGTKTVGVRVTSRGGEVSSATTSIEVRKAPPSGEAGLSILDGEAYTNNKAVKLSLVWPEYATEARISNDGGFAASKTSTVPLSPLVDWNLDDSVKGIYTKVVYVRFSGSGVDSTKTYSDDIILDSTPPVLESVSVSSSGDSVRLGLKATDDVSGVGEVEILSGGSTITREYASTVSLPVAELRVSSSSVKAMAVSGNSVQVRVVDNAGNVSPWRSVSVPSLGGSANLKVGSSRTHKSLASLAKIAVPSSARISVRVSSSSARVCRVVGTSVRGVKAGTCRVTITVTPKRGRPTLKQVTLKVTAT